jgi:dTDP-4-dehydrorhamnose 3,5-epimerase
MNLISTPFQDLFIIEPRVFNDQRGYFFESYNKKRFDHAIRPLQFVQDNESYSRKNVIRGLHYQLNPHAQDKLVRVISGTIYDVVVDLRKGSESFGQWFGVELSSENKKQLFIPAGFAHGFSVLSDHASISYKCSDVHHPESECGIHCFDPFLNIDWKVPEKEAVLSEKDQQLSFFEKAIMNFEFKQAE